MISDVYDRDTLSIEDVDVADFSYLEENEEEQFQTVLFLSADRLVLHMYRYYIQPYGPIVQNHIIISEIIEFFISGNELKFFLMEDTVFQKCFMYNSFCATEN